MPSHKPDSGPRRAGNARDTLAVPAFRAIFIASFLSNTGRWMQQVVLGVFAWELTESEVFVTRVIVAQFLPMLLLGVVGGALADTLDRRKLLITTQAWQAAWSLVLAFMVADGQIGEWTLLAVVFAIGLSQAFFGPAFAAVLPNLAGRENLGAAIALNSTQMNASRVIGPAVGAWLAAATSVSAVFAVNAASYLFVIGALLLVALPELKPTGRAGVQRLVSGFRIAHRVPQIRQPLLIMATFALLCLPFVGLMPAIAERNLGINAQSTAYGILYACFGLGALVGTASVGTLLVRAPRPAVIRVTLVLFAAALAGFSLLRAGAPAYPMIFLVGLFYFVMPTTLTTFLQEHLDDGIRGRIMALWMLAFAGMIPLNNLIAGPLAAATSITAVLLGSAAVALVLGMFARLRPGPVVGDEVLHHRRSAHPVPAVTPRVEPHPT